jgi:CHAD domain-containing protein
MTKKYKWQIKELKYSKQLKKNAGVILKNRLEFLIQKVNQYFKNKSPENLHELRIALRRVRYPMEVFFVCYNKKIFIKLYNKIKKLQDLSGATRDVDITIEQLNLSVDQDLTSDSDLLLLKMTKKKIELQKKFDDEINSFVKSKIFRDFYTQNF